MIDKIEYLLNFFAVLFWATRICQERLTKDKRRWIAGGCFLAGVLFMQEFGETEIKIMLINLSLMVAAYLILTEGKWTRKIVVYLFSEYYLQIFYEPIGLLVRTLANHVRVIRSFAGLLQSLLAIACVWIFSYRIGKNEKWVRWIKEEVSVKYYFVGFLCAFAVTGLASYIETGVEGANRGTRLLILSLTMIVSIFIYIMGIMIAVINTYRKHYKRESILKDEYLRLSKKHYESLSANIREVRSLRHDMKAHFNAMAYLAGKKDWEKLSGYLQAVQDAADKSIGQFVNVNHELVNAILTDALTGKDDVAFQCEGLIPRHIGIDDFDLCTIFSNLISNSLEGCERLQHMQKEIFLEIKCLQRSLYIRMDNPVEDDIDLKKLGDWTAKGDSANHGYGVHNIRAAVEKYHGDLMFQCENHRFMVEIVFWDALK